MDYNIYTLNSMCCSLIIGLAYQTTSKSTPVSCVVIDASKALMAKLHLEYDFKMRMRAAHKGEL